MWLLLACADKSISLGSAEEVQQACEDAADQIEVTTATILFAEDKAGCAWGEDGNNEREDAHFSAQKVDIQSVTLPGDAVACDLGLDFAAVNGGEGTPMVYDDNFVFTFNDVVLATSYEPLLEWLEPTVEVSYRWDWEAVRGQDLEFNNIPTWCIGQAEGLSECRIPQPESFGVMEMAFDPSIATELGYLALSEARFDFGFIALGDNDDGDCSHLDFSFEVEIPYLPL